MKSLNKWERARTEIYYQIFRMMVNEPRISYKKMAEKMGHTGRGRSNSNYYQHHSKMKKQMITRNPICVLKPFKSSKINTYFCRVQNGDKKQDIFNKMLKNGIEYVMFLVGNDDFFITTRNGIKIQNLAVNRESVLYDAIFTIPPGWNRSLSESISNLEQYDFTKGNFERKIYTGLNWSETEKNIYSMLNADARLAFSQIGRKLGIDHKTVRNRFEEKILPHVDFAHYFFPYGYDFYRQTFLEIETEYEKSLVKALETLTTTTYIYVLKNSICINFFHDNSNRLLKTIQKMEQIGIISNYETYIPIDSNETF